MTKLMDYSKKTSNMKVQEKYNWFEGTIKKSIQQGNNSKDLSNNG